MHTERDFTLNWCVNNIIMQYNLHYLTAFFSMNYVYVLRIFLYQSNIKYYK